MTASLMEHLVVPVADDDDAAETARLLDPYELERVTVVHVVEHTPGGPDSIPVEQAEEQAADSFAAFETVIADFEEELAYGTDVVESILDVARDVDASAIAFRPRGGSRVVQFLSGDTALRLVTETDRPVIALPEDSEDDE